MREADIKDMGINIGGRKLSNLQYADNTGLLADYDDIIFGKITACP